MPGLLPFQSSSDVYDWISRFLNLERGQSHRSFRLDRMNALAELAGRPEKCAPSVHVAGSKGKGSVTGMAGAILEASGFKTARYASPHVADFRERLSLGNGFFPEDIYTKAGQELKKLVDALPTAPGSGIFDPHLPDGEEPTFFELMTIWFFLCARKARAGAMAVETGIGGRLDATNIITPLVSVITLIEKEHTELLGDSLAAIAGEKAGIIKPGRPLVLAEQSPEALNVFKERCALLDSELIYFPDHGEIRNIRISREGTRFDLALDGTVLRELFVPIPGEVQARNAGLSVLAIKTAFGGITEDQLRSGLRAFSLPARFERISKEPEIVIDGAHTAASTQLCVNTFTGLYGKRGVLLFGCVAGKDLASMAELCLPNFSTVIITTPGTFKKSFPEEIFTVFKNEAERTKAGTEILFVPDTAGAIDKAVSLAREEKLPVLGAGSFYLAAEIRNRILKG